MDLIFSLGAVAILGGLGSVLRHFLSMWSGVLPWGILLANSSASFIAGFAISNDLFEVALIVGLAGGLSTFSTFAAQTHNLWVSGNKSGAIVNSFLNLTLPALGLLTAVFWL